MRGLRLLPAALADIVRTTPGFIVFGEVFMLAGAGGCMYGAFAAPVQDASDVVMKACFAGLSVGWLGWTALRLRRNVRLATARTVFYNSLKGRGEPREVEFEFAREPDRPWQIRVERAQDLFAREGPTVHYERSEVLGEIVFESRHVRCGRGGVRTGAPDGRWMARLPAAPGVRVPHYQVEPADILEEPGADKLLPRAAVGYVAGWRSGDHYIFRYTSQGRYVGETWHHSLAAARAQLVFEYGDAATDAANWHDIPRYERNPIRYALRMASTQGVG